MNYIELNITNQPLKENFVYPSNVGGRGSPSYVYISIENVKDDVLNLFREYNIELTAAVLFCKKPNAINPLHSDVVLTDQGWQDWACAINWNLTEAESTMWWYESTDEKMHPDKIEKNSNDYILSGIHYGHWNNIKINPEKTKLLQEYKLISTPCLVRTDIPHQIKNNDTKDRWCLSLRPNVNYSWEEALEIFRPLYK
jgi:hypothetical protein